MSAIETVKVIGLFERMEIERKQVYDLLRRTALGADTEEAIKVEELIEICLDKRQSTVIRMRFGIGTEKLPSQAKIGEYFGVTGGTIGAIEKKAISKLKWGWKNGINRVKEAQAERVHRKNQAEEERQRLITLKQQGDIERKFLRAHMILLGQKSAILIVNDAIKNSEVRGFFLRTILRKQDELNELRERSAFLQRAIATGEANLARIWEKIWDFQSVTGCQCGSRRQRSALENYEAE